MTPWSALFKAAAPLWGWILAAVLALFIAAFGAGAWIGYGIGHDGARLKCETARAESERKAREWYEAEIAKRDRQAANERARADEYRRRLAASQAAASRETEDLRNALSTASLKRCDARGPARVLRNKAARIRRALTGARAHAGRVHVTARPAAGDARPGA